MAHAHTHGAGFHHSAHTLLHSLKLAAFSAISAGALFGLLSNSSSIVTEQLRVAHLTVSITELGIHRLPLETLIGLLLVLCMATLGILGAYWSVEEVREIKHHE